MQRVLDLATDEWSAVVNVAADMEGIFEGRTTRSAEESTRRACKRLWAEGRVELAYLSKTSHAMWPYRPDTSNAGRQPAWLMVRARITADRSER